MPRPRFDKLSPERREQMMEAAAREFAQHGYDGASLNHILQAAGVSKGAAYYYFDDKADLFVTVVGHYAEHLAEHTDYDLAHLDAKRFWPALEELYRQGIDHLDENPWMLGVAKSVWRLSKEARGQRKLADLFGASRQLLEGFVERGQKVGAIRRDLPTDLLVSLIVGLDAAWDQWFLENLERRPAREMKEITYKLLGAARRLLEPDKGARK
ncbi:MAG TPA: TetR/AcrR family transcriptional regulator [Myxococcales bacterium]|jgi:AcrR family transcriptional regulator